MPPSVQDLTTEEIVNERYAQALASHRSSIVSRITAAATRAELSDIAAHQVWENRTLTHPLTRMAWAVILQWNSRMTRRHGRGIPHQVMWVIMDRLRGGLFPAEGLSDVLAALVSRWQQIPFDSVERLQEGCQGAWKRKMQIMGVDAHLFLQRG